MARRMVLECDECGSEGSVGTLEFAVAGQGYTLDLCPSCSKSTRAVFEGLIAKATPAGSAATRTGAGAKTKSEPIMGARRRGRPRKDGTPVGSPRVTGVDPDPAAVRAWARSQGLEVPKRGRVPNDLVVKFQEAGN